MLLAPLKYNQTVQNIPTTASPCTNYTQQASVPNEKCNPVRESIN
jgi:hypothetical protein